MDNNIILKAAHFAAQKHRDQRRKDEDSSPYINHPIKVALIISDIGKIQDTEIIAAALLHDTIEDTNTKPEELEELFGTRIRKLVEEVTDDKTLNQLERKKRQVEHAAELTEDAILIKLGDKIANVMDVTNTPPKYWTKDRRSKYFDWAEAVINNCSKTNPLLEDYFRKILREGRKKLIT